MFKISSTQKFDFKCHHGQRCRWLLGTKHCADGVCCDVINYVTCTLKPEDRQHLIPGTPFTNMVNIQYQTRMRPPIVARIRIA